MKFKELRCVECAKGGGTVRLMAKPGRTDPRGPFPSLPVPADLEIPTCDACGEEYFNGDTAIVYDAAMDEVMETALQAQAQEALRAIKTSGVALPEVERALGLSPGYFSRLAKEKRPSAALTAALTLISAAPELALERLHNAWRGGSRVQTALKRAARETPRRAAKKKAATPTSKSRRAGVG